MRHVLNTADESMICIFFIAYLIITWVLQSVHSWYIIQRVEFYTQNQFFKKSLLLIMRNIFLRNSFFVAIHILRACLAVSQCLNGCLIVVSELAVVSQGQGKVTLFFSKIALRKIF